VQSQTGRLEYRRHRLRVRHRELLLGRVRPEREVRPVLPVLPVLEVQREEALRHVRPVPVRQAAELRLR
jgi:hypothetical protein